MKRIITTIGVTLSLMAALFVSSCNEEIDPIVEELEFGRAFSPVGLNTEISNQTRLTLFWTSVKNCDHYVLEILMGENAETGTQVYTTEIPATDESQMTYSYELPAGDTWFVAKVKAISSLPDVAESKWSTISFKTLPENLFLGYSSELAGLNSCIIRWKPGVEVSSLEFDNGVATSYEISTAEAEVGEKTLTGIQNGNYIVRLKYATATRGTTNVLIEGDALLTPGGDLTAALESMSPGGVLLLTNGASYGMTKPDTVRSSIKIRGLSPDDLPVIYLVTGGGNHMFDIDPSMTLNDSLVFEYVDISMAFDDGSSKHRGLIDQENTAMNIGKIRFVNCILRNSGRSAIRLRSGSSTMVQYIDLVEFNNCIMYDYAFSDHYGVLNGALYGNFGNIKFINSTVYNLRGGIINYGNGAGCQSVVIDNCTFDQVVMDASTARFFIDFGTTNNTSAGTIAISDCIFGGTSAIANGVRPGLMTLSVTGSYYTADFVNITSSVTGSMTAYSGSSSALWVDPVTAGDFHFLDQNFAGKGTAGDPRWK